jgi:hypothetical protein
VNAFPSGNAVLCRGAEGVLIETNQPLATAVNLVAKKVWKSLKYLKIPTFAFFVKKYVI